MTRRDHQGARRRHLSEEERHLWGRVARSVRPLHEARPVDAGSASEPRPSSKRRDPPQAQVPQAVAPPAPPPALAPIDRRLRQKLARGRNVIDARIDLHGLTQSQAHAALRRFLLRAQAGDARYVLVVTGRGRGPERGILRRQVPLWLGLPEFRSLVVGFDTAHVAHGGEGALYVQVRRRQRSETGPTASTR
jgi:DNA-nicking Smr family endonuclease